MSASSRVLETYKSIGQLCEDSPSVISFGNESSPHMLYCSIGNSYHAYAILPSISIATVGPQFKHKISSIVAYRHNEKEDMGLSKKSSKGLQDFIFVATMQDIAIVNQREIIGILRGHIKSVVLMTMIGSYLISISKDGECLVWDPFESLNSESMQIDPIRRFKLSSDSTPSCVIHPYTYLDKLLIGTTEGHIDLYNIRTGNLIYRFGPFEKVEDKRTQFLSLISSKKNKQDQEIVHASVTCMINSTALDVIAIGLSDGQIILHNIKYDRTLFKFTQNPGPITSLAFREDDDNYLLSGNSSGQIALWNLETQTLSFTLSAHFASIKSIHCLPGDAHFITTGADNTIKTFVFVSDDRCVQEHQVSGHFKAPQKVRYYDPLGNWVLSTGGLDRQIRMTSVNTLFSQQISQSKYVKKQREDLKKHASLDSDASFHSLMLPPVIDFDTCYLRQDDWENLVTCHEDSVSVYLWNIKNGAMNHKKILKSKPQYGCTQCVALSICGNYVVIGRSEGFLEKWNVQSGNLKGRFVHPNYTQNAQDLSKIAHDDSVTNVMIDNTNSVVVSVSFDKFIRFWDLASMKMIKEILLQSPAECMVKSKESNFVAVALENHDILIFDLKNMNLIRHFQGAHKDFITDLSFSPDSRYLASTSMDSTLIIWDIISSSKIDWIKLSQAATSVDYHPDGTYLCTTHVNSVGIHLWINKMKFGTIILQNAPNPIRMQIPMFGEITIDSEIVENESSILNDVINMKQKRKREEIERDDNTSSDTDHSDNDDDDDDDLNEKEKQSDIPETKAKKQRKKKNEAKSIVLDDEFNGIIEKVQNDRVLKLSGLPKHQWHTITNLDLIRQRNKPTSVKEKITAPFFLTSTPTHRNFDPLFVKNTEEDNKEETKKEEGITGDFVDVAMAIIGKLNELFESGSDNYGPIIEEMKKQPAKTIDIMIRLLSGQEECKELVVMMDFLIHCLQEGSNFDLVQAVTNLFLQVHGETLIKCGFPSVYSKVRELKIAQQKTWESAQSLMHDNLCLIKYMNNML